MPKCTHDHRSCHSLPISLKCSQDLCNPCLLGVSRIHGKCFTKAAFWVFCSTLGFTNAVLLSYLEDVRSWFLVPYHFHYFNCKHSAIKLKWAHNVKYMLRNADSDVFVNFVVQERVLGD